MSGFAQTTSGPAFKNILFATDFSPSSEAALPYLRKLAVRYASTVHVVYVLAPKARTAVPIDALPELDVEESEAESSMQRLLASRWFEQIAHTSNLERGHVWEAIATLAEVRTVDLIVVASHGRRGLKKLVLGSTAEQVIRMARRPVLTVGPAARDAGMEDASLGAILFATDFSEGAEVVLRYAAGLARQNHANLILLHALPPAVEIPPGDMDSIPVNVAIASDLIAVALAYARGRMEELAARVDLRELATETIIECAPPEELISVMAKEKKAGLIVMGAHRSWMHSIAGHLPWDTTSAVVCEAPCPVLTLRS